jgi:hypothetical protein
MINKRADKINSITNQSLLNLSEISIQLNSYDDIFSVFDPNVYAERTLSDDFLIHAKKISKNKSGNKMSLRFLLPENKRNAEEEKAIVKRLHFYFKNVHQHLQSAIRKTVTSGLIFSLAGIALMIAASYISFTKPEKYPFHLLLVLFEPAGWFLLWVGLDHLVYSSKETKKDLAFYSKMIKSEINFFTH